MPLAPFSVPDFFTFQIFILFWIYEDYSFAKREYFLTLIPEFDILIDIIGIEGSYFSKIINSRKFFRLKHSFQNAECGEAQSCGGASGDIRPIHSVDPGGF